MMTSLEEEMHKTHTGEDHYYQHSTRREALTPLKQQLFLVLCTKSNMNTHRTQYILPTSAFLSKMIRIRQSRIEEHRKEVM
jgi:hypothetical protein